MSGDRLTLLVEFQVRADEVSRDEWLSVWNRRAVDAFANTEHSGEPDPGSNSSLSAAADDPRGPASDGCCPPPGRRSVHDGLMPAGLDGNPKPISTPARAHVLDIAASAVSARRRAGKPLLVGVDGIDGSGKSTFADELTAHLRRQDVPVVRSTIDSFHNPRDVRWSKGKTSPVGFYLDSHDFTAVRDLLLEPMRAGPGASYRVAAFDEPTDQPVEEPAQTTTGDEVLVFDGIFLCRPELIGYWDYVIFLEAQVRVDLDRLGSMMTDAPPGGPELVDHVLNWVRRVDRYSSGMRYYLDSEQPKARADLIIDNNDLANPFVATDASPS